jgi:ketosteroid isomerase-like protein
MTDNITFISSLYEAFGRGEIETILVNCDPTVIWFSNCNEDLIARGGTRHGTSGVVSFFVTLSHNLDFELFEPQRFLDSGDAVTVLGRTRAQVKTGAGRLFECRWVHVFTLSNGKRTRFEEF